MLSKFLMSASSIPRSLDFIAASYYTSTTAVSSVTFSGVSIGAADSTRVVIVGVYAGAAAARTITSVTADGISMSLFTKLDNDLTMGGFYYLSIPSGTTATFVANFSGTVSPAALVVYSVKNWNAISLFDSKAAFGTAAARSDTVTTAQNGAVLVLGANYTGGSSSTGNVTNLDLEDANTSLRTTTRFIAGHSVGVSSGSLTAGITYSRTATINSPLIILSLN